MKKLAVLSLFTVLCASAFCQTKTDTTKGKGQTADFKVPQPSITQYVIIMNESQISELLGFIQNADMWSDKGRGVYLEKLKAMVTVIPAAPDTARKK